MGKIHEVLNTYAAKMTLEAMEAWSNDKLVEAEETISELAEIANTGVIKDTKTLSTIYLTQAYIYYELSEPDFLGEVLEIIDKGLSFDPNSKALRALQNSVLKDIDEFSRFSEEDEEDDVVEDERKDSSPLGVKIVGIGVII